MTEKLPFHIYHVKILVTHNCGKTRGLLMNCDMNWDMKLKRYTDNSTTKNVIEIQIHHWYGNIQLSMEEMTLDSPTKVQKKRQYSKERIYLYISHENGKYTC